MAVFVVALHVVGIAALLSVEGIGALTISMGVLAYSLGVRHAFDADHIAAIDNVTRNLTATREPARPRPLSVGFWFSLGHSTVVIVMVALLVFGVRAMVGPVTDESSALHTVTGIWGPTVSGLFLWVLGLVNLVALISMTKMARRMRAGEFDEAQFNELLESRGLMARVLRQMIKLVRKPRHMYPVGFLFGLGFDTATEIGLLALAAGAASTHGSKLPIWVLPVLFTAGMCLMDSIDGVFMSRAYGWGATRPTQALAYNLSITGLSVAVALGVGTISLLGVVVEQAAITSGPLAALAGVNLDLVGYGLVAASVLLFGIALAMSRRLGVAGQAMSPYE